MRRLHLSKYLCGFLYVLFIFQLLPTAAPAQNVDFSGTWNFNSFRSGPGAPWWERGTVTVAADGTFTGTGVQSTGASASLAGSFSTPSNGIVMSLNAQSSTAQCMTDSTYSTLTCTATLSDGSSNLMILTRQPSSPSLASLVGTWEGSVLSSNPNSSWERASETVNSDGTFTESYTKSDGTTGGSSGTLAISSDGVITCASGACMDPSYQSFLNGASTVMVGTSGATASGDEAKLLVFTKKPASISITGLSGFWEVSSLASGPKGPWWQSGILYINTDGTCSFNGTASDGTVTTNQAGSVSISSDGVISLSLGNTQVGYVDPNMDVMVLTTTWPDGATQQISILTNAYSYFPNSSAVATVGTPTTSVPSTNSYSPYAAGTGAFGAPQSNTSTNPASAARSPGGASAAKSARGAALTGPSGETETGSAPALQPAGSQTAAAPHLPAANYHALIRPTVPGAPTIVTVTPGNSQALVNFKLPSRDGGQPISSCTVTVEPGGATTTRVGSPIRVSDLQNGISYTFSVTAANKVGAGPPSDSSKTITVGRLPTAPKIVKNTGTSAPSTTSGTVTPK
ncbi:MAG: fibronectin type III domain-containing protein [Syntrophobacteraceae bacterium]